MNVRSRRRFLGRSLPAAGLLAAAGGQELHSHPPAQARRPNLVFVFSDQQSWDTLGCYGNRQAVTPNLDRLASEGVRFNHCISSSPLCTPFRGMLLSGLHPLHSGAIENDVRMLPGGGRYFGEVLRDAGYRMGYFGKWHLYGGNRVRPIPPGADRYGFDHQFLSNNCTLVYDKERSYYWDEEGNRRLYGDYEPYAQTRQAMRFVDENAGRPFALFLSWHPPHSWTGTSKSPAREARYEAPEDLLRLYDPAALRLRANCEDHPSNRKVMQGYLAMCSAVDRAFGWLVDKLREHNLGDDTIVVFTSDHGDTAMSHGLGGNKMRPEVESIRVPLLIRYPRLLKPRASDLLVGTLDLMPTLLGIMGIQPPSSCQGNNLTQAIVKARDNEVDSVPLFLVPLDWRGVYTRRYTYSHDVHKSGWCHYRDMWFRQPPGLAWNCLYDRQDDPAELKNLQGSAAHKRVRDRLHEQMLAWMKRFGDTGRPYEEVAKAVYRAEDMEQIRSRKWSSFSGQLKGRPIDLL